jgi:hypothetical protein
MHYNQFRIPSELLILVMNSLFRRHPVVMIAGVGHAETGQDTDSIGKSVAGL